MNPLLLWGLLTVGVLVLSAVVYGLGIRTGYAFGRSSSPETPEAEARRTVRDLQAKAETAARFETTENGETMWIGPEDERTKDAAEALRTDSSTPTQTISGTWSSTMETADRPGPDDVPRGFHGEDLSDEDVDEWLQEWGLSGYE